MTVSVDPDSRRNTHHVKISKAASDVGLILSDLRGNEDAFQIHPEPNPRTPLRTMSGELEYGDINPHLSSLAQKNFSVGRGYRDFDDERNGYADARGVDTTREGVVLPGGQYFYANPETIRGWGGNWPRHDGSGGDVDYAYYQYTNFPLETSKFIAKKFTTTTGFDAAFLEIVCLLGAVEVITVTLRSDNAGDPGTIRGTVTISSTDVEDINIIQHVRKSIAAYTLTAATAYWIVAELTDVVNVGSVLVEAKAAASSDQKVSGDGAEWGNTNYSMFCRATTADKPFKALFQEYKGGLYTALSYFDNSAPKVFANGYQGVALGTSTSTQIDVAGTPFVADEHIGAICYIWGGVGATQYRPWRKIVDNDTNLLMFTGDPWDITPDVTTVIGIMASEKFVEVPGVPAHGLTTAPQDFLSTHQCMYLAMGQGVNIKRLVCFNNAGGWSQVYADDSTNKADLLFAITAGNTTKIWAGNRAASEVAGSYAVDGAGGGPANLSFTVPAAFDVGSTDTKINSLGVYGDTPHLWVFKEDIPYEIVSDVPYEFRSAQMKAMRDWRNGKANIQFDRNLFWAFREGCERWSESGDLLHMGPEVRGPEGMPDDRRGYFADFAEYGGLMIGAYDGGDSNYSSILAWNGEGWHELFRAPWKGARILSLKTQSIEGNAVDRLWFGCGSDVMCIPISENPEQHSEETYNFYPYIWIGNLETGWIYYNLREIEKYFDAVKGVLDDTAGGDYTRMTIRYKIDTDTSWTRLGAFYASPSSTLDFSADNDLTAQKMKLRFEWCNYSNNITGKFFGWVLNLALTLDQKYVWRIRFRIKDNDVNLHDIADDIASGLAKLVRLKTWANEKSPVLVNSYDPTFNDIYGMIDYPSLRTIAVIEDEGIITRVCEMSIKEI